VPKPMPALPIAMALPMAIASAWRVMPVVMLASASPARAEPRQSNAPMASAITRSGCTMPCAEMRIGPTSKRNPPVTRTTISVSPATVAIHARTRVAMRADRTRRPEARSREPGAGSRQRPRRADDHARLQYTNGS